MTQHRSIVVPAAAKAKGPYASAVAFDRLLFVASPTSPGASKFGPNEPTVRPPAPEAP